MKQPRKWSPNPSDFFSEEQNERLLKIKSVEMYEIKLIWIKTKKNALVVFQKNSRDIFQPHLSNWIKLQRRILLAKTTKLTTSKNQYKNCYDTNVQMYMISFCNTSSRFYEYRIKFHVFRFSNFLIDLCKFIERIFIWNIEI